MPRLPDSMIVSELVVKAASRRTKNQISTSHGSLEYDHKPIML
jgi:hypothetical protein